MFNFLKKDPLQKLDALRNKKLEEAMHIQRSGDLRRYADKVVEISKIEKEIDDLRKVSDTSLASVKKVSDTSSDICST